MEQKRKGSSRKILYALGGILLGTGAPLSHVALHMVQMKEGFLVSALGEFKDHGFLLALLAPFLVGIFGFLLGIFQDKLSLQKEDLERITVRLESQSMTDDLTGLYNHRHLLVEIDREVERANRYGRAISGMMIDIDDFKKVNDEYGHLAGDELLIQIADVLRRNIRNVDILGRYAGDEFFVILPETELAASRIVAERIKRNVAAHNFRFKRIPLSATVSIGLFSFPAFQKFNIETFMNQTDQMLLGAKRAGKNQVLTGHA